MLQRAPPRARERAGPREVVELNALRARHPELAPAIDLQVELLEIQRRVLPRIPIPSALLDVRASTPRPDGRPLLTWDALAIDWNEFRAVLRETIDALRRFDSIEPEEALFLTMLTRDGDRLAPFAETWFRSRVAGETPLTGCCGPPELARAIDGSFDNTLALALKPFLVRCAEAIAPRLQLEATDHGRCPLCGAEPELAILSHESERLLVCGRCTLRWPYPADRCPFCENPDSRQLRTFASPDRIYRLIACESCSRYVKAYDERFGTRPALPGVDVIAMLPLDAVAVQRGYVA